MVTFTLNSSALTGLAEALFSRNPLGGDGVSLLLQALPRGRLARLTLSGTCSNARQFSQAMEEPAMAEFFREVWFVVCGETNSFQWLLSWLLHI